MEYRVYYDPNTYYNAVARDDYAVSDWIDATEFVHTGYYGVQARHEWGTTSDLSSVVSGSISDAAPSPPRLRWFGSARRNDLLRSSRAAFPAKAPTETVDSTIALSTKRVYGGRKVI